MHHQNHTDPRCDTIELADGGNLSLVTLCDNAYRLILDKPGLHVDLELTSTDVKAFRDITGHAVLAHLHAAAAETTG